MVARYPSRNRGPDGQDGRVSMFNNRSFSPVSLIRSVHDHYVPPPNLDSFAISGLERRIPTRAGPGKERMRRLTRRPGPGLPEKGSMRGLRRRPGPVRLGQGSTHRLAPAPPAYRRAEPTHRPGPVRLGKGWTHRPAPDPPAYRRAEPTAKRPRILHSVSSWREFVVSPAPLPSNPRFT